MFLLQVPKINSLAETIFLRLSDLLINFPETA